MRAVAQSAITADSQNAGKPLIMAKNAGYSIFAHSWKASRLLSEKSSDFSVVSEAEPVRLDIHVAHGLPKSAQILYPAFFI
jgi:hypothetical protein